MFSANQDIKRTHESPMDFEWHGQGHGPTDPSSPFSTLKPAQRQGFATPRATMNSFAQASSVPAPQFRNPSFTTPRKGTFDLDLQSEQSGIESSPGGIADGEDTPDLPRANKSTMAILTGGPQKQPIFSKYGSAYSPGRLEQRRGKVGSTLMKHTRKRQRRERDEMALIGGRVYGSDSESEGDTKPKSKAKNAKQDNKPHWFTTMMSSIESHPNVPHVLTNYAQFGYNFFLLSITTFGLYSFWMTIRADVDKAAEEAKAGVLAEIAQCTRDYVQNGCAANNRAPALESVCHNWESCMSRDADSVGRAAVSASTFARILNSFVEPISYKTMLFVVLIIAISLFVNNFALGLTRSKTAHHVPPTAHSFFPSTPHHQYQWGPPPQTPQQHNVGYDGFTGQTYQQIMPSQTPSQRSPSKGNRSPSKGDRY